MANPGESNWQILNVGYGVLNPVGDTLSGKVYNTNDTGFFSMVRQSTVDHFSPSSGVNNGPLVGIVLRNEGKMDLTGPVDPTSWASKYSQLMEKREGLSLIQLRVRIPEIHAHLPVPKNLPPRDDPSEDHGITNLYPVFVGQFDNIDGGAEPVHGSLVWVDFQNRATFQGPIYLGAVEGSKTFLPNLALATGAAFAGACNRALNESVDEAGSKEEKGKAGGSTGGAEAKPIVSEDGTPKAVKKTGSALGSILTAAASLTTIGKLVNVAVASTKEGKKAKKAVVASIKKGANAAVKVYCKNLETMRGNVEELKKRYQNVPFPDGTPTCTADDVKQLIKDHFTPGGSKWNGGMLDSFIANENPDPWKTGTTKEERAANAIKIYETFVGNGYTPQAGLAVLSHLAGETQYDSRVPGGGRNTSLPKDDPNHWMYAGPYQTSKRFSTSQSKTFRRSDCIDKITGEDYYDKIGGGKKAGHAPQEVLKEIGSEVQDPPRLLAKEHTYKAGGRGSLTKEQWEAGNYFDAGDVKNATMFQIARLRRQRGNSTSMGSLDALMRNPDATGAQVYALMRNSTFAKGAGLKEQKSTKRRMDNAAKKMGTCYTGNGYQQNFEPGTI
jgi:hypothetical protein